MRLGPWRPAQARPRGPPPADILALFRAFDAGEGTLAGLARLHGVSRKRADYWRYARGLGHVPPRRRLPGPRARAPKAGLRGRAGGPKRLTAADIPLIRALRAEGLTLRAIAAKFDVSSVTVLAVTTYRTWRHVLD
jgi:hypothetical protein